MSLSVTPATDNSQDTNSSGASALPSDDESFKKALEKERSARKKKAGGAGEPLPLATMALLARQLDHHMVLQKGSHGFAPVTQTEHGEISSRAAMTQQQSALLSDDKGQRAKILALMEASSSSPFPSAPGLTTEGSTLDPSASGKASSTVSGSGSSTSASLPGSDRVAGGAQASPLSNSPPPGFAGVMPAGPLFSSVAPTSTDAGLLSQVTVKQPLASAPMGDEDGSAGDQKDHDKDEASAVADAGLAAGNTAGPADTSPLYTELAQAFGGPSHRPATPSTNPQTSGAKTDQQGVTYNFNTWGDGTDFVKVSGTTESGYTLTPSSPDIARVLESSLPADGNLPVQIDSPPTDLDQLQAVKGSTDSEKKDQSEE